MSQGKHTILLAQPGGKVTRTYFDFPTVRKCTEYVIGDYERKLKEANPTVKNITYDVLDLYKYVDSFGDIGCLVFDAQSNKYVPQDKEWIKQRILLTLKQQSTR